MNKLQLRPGPETLNGPILEGVSCLLAVTGVQVLITAPSQGDLDIVILYLHRNASAHVIGMQGGAVTRTAQPPWYQNETKERDLNDLMHQAPARRRATLTGAA